MAGRIRQQLGHIAALPPKAYYWRDSNLRFHRYLRIDPSPDVGVLLAEIEADPTAIFWG